MREIDLGKRLGESPQPNIIKFIGCVTTQSKQIVILRFLHLIKEGYDKHF